MKNHTTVPRLHAVVLTIPAQGHINPLLYLSGFLASKGCIITFVLTQNSHENMLRSGVDHNPDINFVTIPDGVAPGVIIRGPDTFRLVLKGLEQQQEVIQKLIEVRLGLAPVTCLISEPHLSWSRGIANRLGIRRVIFWTSSSSALYINTLWATEKLTDEEISHIEDTDLALPGLPLSKTDIVSVLPTRYPGWRERIAEFFRGIEHAAGILVNTFHALDGSVLDAIPFNIPIRSVGPLLPHVFLTEDADQTSLGRSLLTDEEEACLKWLDSQAASSVLYISFGSIFTPPPTQMEQLALAIESSEQPFVWVIRLDTESSSKLPEGFVNRTKDRGLFISWAPQLLVLRHSAIGGFLTHCGWNSAIESIFMGVPMLCWPIMIDQPLNALVVVKAWQIGMDFVRTADGLVAAEEVERVVRVVMQSEEGEQMRTRAACLAEAAREATREQGSSMVQLEAFIRDMTNCEI